MIHEPQARIELRILDYEGEAYALDTPALRMSWVSNSVRQADTLNATILAANFPFDLRSISDAVVVGSFRDASLAASDQIEARERVFVGSVDEITSRKMNNNVPTLDIVARDYTAYFLDRKVPQAVYNNKVSGKNYDLDRPLRLVIEEMMLDVGEAATRSLLRRFRDHYRYSPANHPVNTNVFKKANLLRPWVTTSGSEDLWSLLARISDLVAAVPFFELDLLRVERAEGFAADREARTIRPEDLVDLSTKRNLNASLGRPVVVRAYNADAATDDDAVIEARYPPNPDFERAQFIRGEQGTAKDPRGRKKALTPEGPNVEAVNDDAAVFFLPNSVSKESLEEIAKGYFQSARAEDLQGTLEMVGPGAPGEERWTLRNGDTFDMFAENPWLRAGVTRAEAEAWYIARGVTPGTASELLRLAEKGLDEYRSYYVKKASHSLDGSGYKVTLDFTSSIGTDV